MMLAIILCSNTVEGNDISNGLGMQGCNLAICRGGALSSPPFHGTLTIKELGYNIYADMPPVSIGVCDLYCVGLQCFLNLFLHALHELRRDLSLLR